MTSTRESNRIQKLAMELNNLAIEKPQNYLARREEILAELIALRADEDACSHGVAFNVVCVECCVCEFCGATGLDPCDPDCEEMSL